MSCNDVLDRAPAIDVERLLRLTERAEPEHHWEGVLVQTHGSDPAWVNLHVHAHLRFAGGAVQGAGQLSEDSDFQTSIGIDLEGAWDAGGVTLSVWIAETSAPPMTLVGQFGADMRTIAGDWRFDCFEPGTCDCGGGGGDFQLRRVD